MENIPKNIELRSEKIKNIIGQMPSFLIRYGNSILCIIFFLLIIFAFCVPFPYRVDSNIYFEVNKNHKHTHASIIYLPSDIISEVVQAKSIYFTLMAYQNEIIPAKLDSISPERKIFNQNLYQKVFITLNDNTLDAKNEINHVTVPLEGKLSLKLPPRTFVERSLRRTNK